MAAEHEHAKAAYDDINVRSISLVVGVGSLLIFVAILAVQVIYFRYSQNEFVQKVESVPMTEVNETLADQRARLEKAGPGADEEKGEKSIPIEQAMKAVVAEYRQRQSAQEQPETAAGEASESAAAGDAASQATATR